MPAGQDLSDRRFGKLVTISLTRRVSGKSTRRLWKCRCDCGKVLFVLAGNLVSGNTTSCGCAKVDACLRRVTHGLSGTFEHRVWKGMRKRCMNPKYPGWRYYGGRGITICKRWDSFENFLKDMGPAPTIKHSLDRINPDKGYFPKNCRWLSRTDQSKNRRDNIRLEHNGERLLFSEWAEKTGIPFGTLRMRYYKLKWTVEKLLTTPARKNKLRK